MPDLDALLACPVCLSTEMHKTPVQAQQTFILDHCDNCGGTWFDADEVIQLRGVKPQDFLQLMANVEGVFEYQCHACGAIMDRNDEKCAACGKPNELDCPRCQVKMARKQRGPLALDVCSKCNGVWFDRYELRQLWQLAFNQVAKGAAADPMVAFYGADVASGLLGDGEIAPGVKLSDVANVTVGTILKTVSTAFE